METGVLLKIHKSYRLVVAVCDSDLLGKIFKDGEKKLEVTKNFFEGELYENMHEVKRVIADSIREDATFFIVGNKSVELAKEMEMVSDEGVGEIDGVSYALVLL